jgi:hypothetical protein
MMARLLTKAGNALERKTTVIIRVPQFLTNP